jgi:membrane protein
MAVTQDHRAARDDDSLKGLLKDVWHEIGDDDILGQAAKLAYFTFLALPPALMALFGFAGLFGDVGFANWIEEQARLAMPPEVANTIIVPFIQQVVLESAPGPLSIGILLALWGASTAIAGLMNTLNKAYDLQEDRPFLKKRGVALAAMLIGTVLFLLSAIALLAGPPLAEAIGIGPAATFIWNIVQWPLAFAFMVAAFWVAYYLLPNRDQAGYEMVLLKAAAAAALLWVLATAAFRIYIANFSSYSETYGIIGAFIVLLLWLYMTGIVVLVGGELASEMEKRA